MTKTLVAPKHFPGPAINGHDGCHARLPVDGGCCPGVETANWLNGLGADDEPYYKGEGAIKTSALRTTNGDVRNNWIRGSNHIVPVEPELAQLRAEERRYRISLRLVRERIRKIEQVR
jgi:hypothetical protein